MVGKMSIEEKSLQLHEQWQGKLEIQAKSKVNSREDLSLAYTPGVAAPCRKIHANKEDVYKYTMKGNTVAVISDGSAVLGLGNIGPEAAMPVMEGKAVLFKEFAGVNAIPLCLDTQDVDELVKTITYLAPTFGGINIEDISAPRCFEIERRLKETLDIPVFHDDQHGTAIVVLAGILNALKLTEKSISSVKVVINGCGSAGIAIGKLLVLAGVKNLIMVDKDGVVHKDEPWLNWAQKDMATLTNPEGLRGSLSDALNHADVFIGVSAPGIVSQDMIRSMNADSIVFAMANPTPEIMPELAKAAGARVIGTGRSDYPNQVNNVLVFPGIFKGILEGRGKQITEEMKLAAANAIADMIPHDELHEENILPEPFAKGVADAVAAAVKRCI
jgi:malate dehydrogenase (oxaloacetate-decarboxylating)